MTLFRKCSVDEIPLYSGVKNCLDAQAMLNCKASVLLDSFLPELKFRKHGKD